MIDSNVRQKNNNIEKNEIYQSLCIATPYTNCSIL